MERFSVENLCRTSMAVVKKTRLTSNDYRLSRFLFLSQKLNKTFGCREQKIHGGAPVITGRTQVSNEVWTGAMFLVLCPIMASSVHTRLY